MLEKLCRYNTWANSAILEALSPYEEQESVPEYCITLLSHIANAQLIWLNRIVGIIPSVTVWQLHDFHTCKRMLQESERGLEKIIEHDELMDRTISYIISTGQSFETEVTDILLHVFNHGTYHRAQIIKEMKRHDMKLVNTDYIMFSRMQ